MQIYQTNLQKNRRNKMSTKIKLNKDLNGYKAGDVITLEDLGYAEKVYWLRRLEDAKIDRCCELIAEGKKEDKATKK